MSSEKEKMVIPTGLTFKFLVKPKLTEEHKKGLKYGIINRSGLNNYYKIADIEFFEDFKDKQMLIKIFCPKPTVTIEKSKEDKFYDEIKGNISKWVINTLKDSKYECILYECKHTIRLS